MSETCQQWIENITSTSKHLSRLARDTSDVSRCENGRLVLCEETISLDESVSDVIRLLSLEALKRELSVQWSPNLASQIRLYCDPLRLRQILLNVVGNALKYSKPGGTVSITFEQFDSFDIVVKDTGIGINAEDIKRVLIPFHRAASATEAKVPGTGLGLALTKALMERHGGSVTVDSVLGVGTTVRLSFPCERVLHDQEPDRAPRIDNPDPRSQRFSIDEDLSSEDTSERSRGLMCVWIEREIRYLDRVTTLLLSDADPDIRARSAWILDNFREIEVKDALLDALDDENENVRSNAAWGLVHLGRQVREDVKRLRYASIDENTRRMADLILQKI